ncbi:MAG: 2Fe-2S iron-sulfur cluster-binding protein, partial [Clostridia bacterium]
MPEGINVEVDKGTNLLDAANAAGITLKSSCGGQGTCGRCCVKVLEGKVE